MRIVVIAVGRWRRDPARALFEHYAGRLAWPVTIKEIEEKRPLKPAQLKAREGEMLLGAIPQGATVIALDPRGEQLASEDLARKIAVWRDGGTTDLAFLIGGAEGLDRPVREGADLVLSLGAMTWPHLLVRAMLAEQLFRVQSILTGHPYHRG